MSLNGFSHSISDFLSFCPFFSAAINYIINSSIIYCDVMQLKIVLNLIFYISGITAKIVSVPTYKDAQCTLSKYLLIFTKNILNASPLLMKTKTSGFFIRFKERACTLLITFLNIIDTSYLSEKVPLLFFYFWKSCLMNFIYWRSVSFM